MVHGDLCCQWLVVAKVAFACVLFVLESFVLSGIVFGECAYNSYN